MQTIRKPILVTTLVVAAIIFVFAFRQQKQKGITDEIADTLPTTDQKIQVAILLDVSNSMDGLIDQAKAQLWNMVNTLGRVQCGNAATPKVEIALYEYGTPRNEMRRGYIRQINDFIINLDSLSGNLFSLTTNGGDEYCGQVIDASVNELQWDTAANSYKVIFIAGNESFRQGNVPFTKACDAAKSKDVIINTIYCGDRQSGIAEFWNLNGECGNGSFSNINQDEKIEDIATPFDDQIVRCNDQLNSTYITYGEKGQQYLYKQKAMDDANAAYSKKTAVKRAEAKANSKMYKNTDWDLVDKAAGSESELEKIDRKTLPDSLQHKTSAELKAFVQGKSKERAAIQAKIVELNRLRQQYVDTQKKNATDTQVATLETEIERILKDQVQRFKMSVK
jgi:hypothetical protein